MQLYKKDNNGVNNPIVSGLSFNNFHEVYQCEEEHICFHYRLSFFCICFNTHEKIPSHFQCIYFFKFILIYILDLCLRIRIYVHVKTNLTMIFFDLIVINSYFLNIESFYNRYTPHFRQMMVPYLFYTVYLMLSFFCYLRNSHNLMHDRNNYIKLSTLRDPYLLLVPLSYFFPYQVLSSQLLYE